MESKISMKEVSMDNLQVLIFNHDIDPLRKENQQQNYIKQNAIQTN